jgi:hypothetical protein
MTPAEAIRLAFERELGSGDRDEADALREALANTAELHRADALIGQLREALWAVRVLDAWAEKHIRRAPSPVCLVDERWSVAVPIRVPGGSETRAFYASTPDAARIAAAKALVAEDPTLEPQELT